MSKIRLKAEKRKWNNVPFRFGTRIYNRFIRNTNPRQFPIIINNFNRLEYLEKQIDWLLSLNIKNIYIIDNASTYPPLLDFYKKTKVNVYLLDENLGHTAFWDSVVYHRFKNYYYVLTDSDLIPDENTPTDFMEYFYDILQRHPAIEKVGFGLHYNDLPDHYPKKNEVFNWEKQFYIDSIEKNVFKAAIDTTFALYRPLTNHYCHGKALRTGQPYFLKHMPWYENPANFNEETRYYIKTTSHSSSWYKSLSDEPGVYDLKP